MRTSVCVLSRLSRFAISVCRFSIAAVPGKVLDVTDLFPKCPIGVRVMAKKVKTAKKVAKAAKPRSPKKAPQKKAAAKKAAKRAK